MMMKKLKDRLIETIAELINLYLENETNWIFFKYFVTFKTM
jgi:hypothetical protein